MALRYPVLSDFRGRVASAFGLLHLLPDYLRIAYREAGLDLPALTGQNCWALPMTARYVIARSGLILYSEVNPDHRLPRAPPARSCLFSIARGSTVIKEQFAQTLRPSLVRQARGVRLYWQQKRFQRKKGRRELWRWPFAAPGTPPTSPWAEVSNP